MIIPSGRVHSITALVIWIFSPNLNLVVLVVGALFPDTDIRTSAMGRILPLWLFFKHRGFTHTIWAALIVYTILYDLFDNKTIAHSYLIGHLSHIILDSITSKRKNPQ